MYYDLMGRAPHYITDWTDGEISPEPIFAVAHVLREPDLILSGFLRCCRRSLGRLRPECSWSPGHTALICEETLCAGLRAHIGILAPATYIFFASAIPALTFGEQLAGSVPFSLQNLRLVNMLGLAGLVHDGTL